MSQFKRTVVCARPADLSCGYKGLYACENVPKLLVRRKTHRSESVQEGEPIVFKSLEAGWFYATHDDERQTARAVSETAPGRRYATRRLASVPADSFSREPLTRS